MQFKEIDIFTESRAVEQLVSMLDNDLGINGFVIHDASDFAEFLENKEHNWDYVDDELMSLKDTDTHITCYLQDNAQGEEAFIRLCDYLKCVKEKDADGFFGRLEIKTDNVREEDWADNWKQYFKPFTVGKSLIIKPSWEIVENADGMKILEIDPASSFGTGQHHTTKACLELIEELVKKGDRLLDLGTGSGILSVAALLFGAESAVMVDIQQHSVETAAENAAKNGFADKVTAYAGDICRDSALRDKIGGGYDIVTANIVADVIIAMSPYLKGFLKSGGRMILSGIIDERLPQVLAALEKNGIIVLRTTAKEGWNAIEAQ